MTLRARIYASILSLAISLMMVMPSHAQHSMPLTEEQEDTTAFLNGFAISADIAGLIQYAVSDYGQFEGALRVNLLDLYFPTLEIGLGRASHDDEVTQITYKSTAPYFRIGADYNLAKDKHDIYRILGGLRYGMSSFKYDVSHPGVVDPIYGGVAPFNAEGVKCTYHWAELLAGVDAKLWGPFHLGWTVRYRKRLARTHTDIGKVWYVPGYGKAGNACFGVTFNLIIDI